MNNKITFPELVDTIAELTNTSKRVSELFLKELFAIVKEKLENGENVKIKGLGTFKVVEMASRKSVNVNNGEDMEIPAHRKVNFTPDKSLAEAINTPFEEFETIILDDDFSEEDIQELSLIEDEDIIDETEADETLVEIDRVEEIVQEIPEILEEDPVEEQLPPEFVPREDEQEVEQVEEETPEMEDETAPQKENEEELPQVEEIAAEDQEIEDVTPAEVIEPVTEVVETQLPVVVYGNFYDEEEHLEVVQRARRTSFVWGLLAGLLVIVAAGYFAITKGYITLNIAPEVVEAEQVESEIETIADIVVTAPVDTIEKVETPAPVASVVTDTVRVNYYLTKMSRKHYGRYEFWVYIYEENKDKIPNPNKVSTGLVVVIPPAEKYGIDKNNEESVQKALAKAEEYK